MKNENILNKEITLFKKDDATKLYFFQQLTILLSAKIDIKTAISIIVDSNDSKKEFEFLLELKKDLIKGKSFSSSLSSNKLFSNFDLNFINVGEETGDLLQVTSHLENYYLNKIKQRRIILSALGYPILVIVITICVLFFMTHYVIPIFENLLIQNGSHLPTLTRIILKISNTVNNNLGMIMLIPVLVMFMHIRFKENITYKNFRYKCLFKIPIFGKLFKDIYIIRFLSVLKLCIDRHVPITQAITLSSDVIPIPNSKVQLLVAKKLIIKGGSLNSSLQNFQLLDQRTLSLLKVGEEVHKVGPILGTITAMLTDQVEIKIKSINQLIEPILIVILGSIVGTILISLYLPLFKLSNTIG